MNPLIPFDAQVYVAKEKSLEDPMAAGVARPVPERMNRWADKPAKGEGLSERPMSETLTENLAQPARTKL